MNGDNTIMDFDDRETETDLLLCTKDMSPEELDAEYERIFGKNKNNEQQ